MRRLYVIRIDQIRLIVGVLALLRPNVEMPHRHLDHEKAIEQLIDILRADVLLGFFEDRAGTFRPVLLLLTRAPIGATWSRGWSMMLGSTLEWFAPTDKSMSSLELFDRWRSLFERSTLGVAMINSEYRFLWANPAFLTMFGYSSEELQQLSFLDICIDEAGDECRVPLRELRDGVRLEYEVETQHRRKDGTSLPVNTYFSAVRERARIKGRFLR